MADSVYQQSRLLLFLLYLCHMEGVRGENNRVHIVAVNMGYGHERPANILHSVFGGNDVVIANDYEGIPHHDQAMWETGRRWYERISRFSHVPMFGRLAFDAFDTVQRIPEFYPHRDLSGPSLALREIYALIERRNFCRHVITMLAKNPAPLICTYFTPAFAAEQFNYPDDIHVLVTDADMNRVWAPLSPAKSRIRYFAPTGRVAERLMMYGVKEKNISLTGYPLPPEAIGGQHATVLRRDLSRRLRVLDPQRIFAAHAGTLLAASVGSAGVRTKKSVVPLSLTFAVGGAGAQREVGLVIAKSLRHAIREGRIILNLVAGTRPEVAKYFTDGLQALGLTGTRARDGVRVHFSANRSEYFSSFTALMRETDVLWTKPSELSFYTGLGLPVIMAPTVGAQEKSNRHWLLQAGSGADALDPRFTHEWLFDWVQSGALARMAWLGFVDTPTHGAYRIADVVLGRPTYLPALPFVA